MKRPSVQVLQSINRLSGSHDWNAVVDWMRESLAEQGQAMYRTDDPHRMVRLAGGCQAIEETIETFDTASKQLEALRREEK